MNVLKEINVDLVLSPALLQPRRIQCGQGISWSQRELHRPKLASGSDLKIIYTNARFKMGCVTPLTMWIVGEEQRSQMSERIYTLNRLDDDVRFPPRKFPMSAGTRANAWRGFEM